MKITDEQLAHLRESFRQYDTNGDNSIDKNELKKVLFDLKVPNADTEADKVLQKLDSDGNGSISFGEFLKALKHLKYLKEVEVDDIIAEYTTPIVKEVEEEIEEEIKEVAKEIKEAAEEIKEIVDLAQKAEEKLIAGDGVLRGSPHVFVWKYEGSFVQLVGDFTNWGEKKLTMNRLDDGHWYYELRLSPGVYEFRFIIDHNIEWYYDICQPNVYNTGSGFINNVLTV